MTALRAAEQVANRIAQSSVSGMSAADDALLTRAAKGMRLRGRSIEVDTTEGTKRKPSADSSAPQPSLLHTIRQWSGDWRSDC